MTGAEYVSSLTSICRRRDGIVTDRTPLTPDQRRDLIERPFPIVRVIQPLPSSGSSVTRWSNGMAPVEGHNRNWEGSAFFLGRVLYGEEYWPW